LRVSAVDDLVDSADSLRVIMEVSGHEARAAYDGAAGLAIAAEFEPQVVFTDIQMPRMSGIELARRLRQLPGLERVFIVAITGTSFLDDRLEGHDILFDEWVLKPYGLRELEALMARVAPTSRG
jgi:DNA-binding response OmpR family regulator